MKRNMQYLGNPLDPSTNGFDSDITSVVKGECRSFDDFVLFVLLYFVCCSIRHSIFVFCSKFLWSCMLFSLRLGVWWAIDIVHPDICHVHVVQTLGNHFFCAEFRSGFRVLLLLLKLISIALYMYPCTLYVAHQSISIPIFGDDVGLFNFQNRTTTTKFQSDKRFLCNRIRH